MKGQIYCDKNYNISGSICYSDNYICDSKGNCFPYNYYSDEITLFCCLIGQYIIEKKILLSYWKFL